MLLHDSFFGNAKRSGERTFLVCDGQSFRYDTIAAHACSISGQLAAAGVRGGDRVVLFMENSARMVAALFAVLNAGGVIVPVNPLTKRDKLKYIVGNAEPRAVLTDLELQAVWAPLEPSLAASGVALHIVRDAGILAVPGSTQPLPAREPALPERIDQDLAALIYTSGSTGDPKGVMLTHFNMASARQSICDYLGLMPSDVIFCALPLSFDYGLYQVLMAAHVGACVVIEPNFAFPRKALAVLAQTGATVFPGVPTMFTLLMGLDSLRETPLPRLRLITNTAAALTETHICRIAELFPHARLFSMYGLTECKRVTYLPPEELARRPTSVGRGMPNEEVWLVDEDGKRLANPAIGELVVRGSNVMRGYWRDPEATDERLHPGPLPGERVLFSGDLFRTDDEGWLYFVSRKDDIIKSRGEKVSPREVENVIHALAGVRDVAVIGVPDSVLGEAVKAFVVGEANATLSARAVIRHCAERLESFMVPKEVEFVDVLPLTNTGKIRKASLRGPS